MDQEIVDFIKNSQVATICCCENDEPYCFNSFYTFIEKDGVLVFKSSSGTKHSQILEVNGKVAGTILPGEISLTNIRGLQFAGTAQEDSGYSLMRASMAYYARYPISVAMPGKIWIIQLKSLKYTDNSKGFGYKNVWEKE